MNKTRKNMYKCKVVSPTSGEQSSLITPYGYFNGMLKIGHCSLRLKKVGTNAGTYTLQNVSIIPEYRGKGLCTRFLKCVLSKYSKKTIFLEVNINNTSAIKCYTKLGFKEISKGTTNMIMCKKLI